jgi:hypothetical protein
MKINIYIYSIIFNINKNSTEYKPFVPSNLNNLEVTINNKEQKILNIFNEQENIDEDFLYEKFAIINNFNYLQHIIVGLFILLPYLTYFYIVNYSKFKIQDERNTDDIFYTYNKNIKDLDEKQFIFCCSLYIILYLLIFIFNTKLFYSNFNIENFFKVLYICFIPYLIFIALDYIKDMSKYGCKIIKNVKSESIVEILQKNIHKIFLKNTIIFSLIYLFYWRFIIYPKNKKFYSDKYTYYLTSLKASKKQEFHNTLLSI